MPSTPSVLMIDTGQLRVDVLERCEQWHARSSSAWAHISMRRETDAAQAAADVRAMVDDLLHALANAVTADVQLLADCTGDRKALHALNVVVVSLMLGRALDVGDATLRHIGHRVLLHHLGMPAPDAIDGVQTVAAGQIIALVQAFDDLCNPDNLAAALTPHEALSQLCRQMGADFDRGCLTAFIRLMGAYPPGTFVQLNDDRFALVVRANMNRPLQPTLLVVDTHVPREAAAWVDMQSMPRLLIRRSLPPHILARPVLDYLSPCKRTSYLFERGSEISASRGGTAWVFDAGPAMAGGRA